MHTQFPITTQAELRETFWSENPTWFARYHTTRKTQNQYPCDVRAAWCDYIDHMARCGDISETLADSATL